MENKGLGYFFVLEGIDGSGHTSISHALLDKFASYGVDVLSTNEPTEGIIGTFIDQVLKGQVRTDLRALQYMFIADRLEHAYELRQWLNEGKVVFCDRYYYSALAYGGATLGKKDREELLDIHLRLDLPRPDLAIIVDVPARVAMERAGKRGEPAEIFEKEQTLSKVRDEFLALAGRPEFPELRVVDNSGALGDAVEEAWGLIRESLGLKKGIDFG